MVIQGILPKDYLHVALSKIEICIFSLSRIDFHFLLFFNWSWYSLPALAGFFIIIRLASGGFSKKPLLSEKLVPPLY